MSKKAYVYPLEEHPLCLCPFLAGRGTQMRLIAACKVYACDTTLCAPCPALPCPALPCSVLPARSFRCAGFLAFFFSLKLLGVAPALAAALFLLRPVSAIMLRPTANSHTSNRRAAMSCNLSHRNISCQNSSGQVRGRSHDRLSPRLCQTPLVFGPPRINGGMMKSCRDYDFFPTSTV